MPKLALERSIDIAKPPEALFEILSNLSRWRPWNPWLVTEPSAEVVVAPDEKSYSWKGKITGAGRMQVTAENPVQSLDLDLEFYEPFKSEAKVHFELERQGEGTHLSWGMDSSLPFFLFFMKKVMTAFIGMDYQRGLMMLKDYAETGVVPSRLEKQGPAGYPGCLYVGLTTECSIDELGPRMAADFEKLRTWKEASVESVGDEAFSVYHTWDLPGGRVKYTSGYPVSSKAKELPPGFVSGEIPKLSTFSIEHVGPYRHLGNAWNVGMQLARARTFRQSKSYPPFEVYSTPPGTGPENEQRTQLHFPAR